MAEIKDVQLLVASGLQKADPEMSVGMDDTHTFVRIGATVFRIQVEVAVDLSKRPNGEALAIGFMDTLPYGPGQ